MADDDIERLLREVASTTGSGTGSGEPAPRQESASPARRTGTVQGRIGFSLVASAVLGVGGWFVGLILPFVGAGSMGFGAAFGAFVTAMVTGAPRWLSR